MRQDLSAAFADQALSCEALGSPFMGQLMRCLPELLHHAPRLSALYAAWPGDPSSRAASLPLRLAGGLHALVRAGQASALARAYPPDPEGELAPALAATLAAQDGCLCDWVQSPPQTNEVGRSAVLLAAATALTARLGLPLHLSELGASAGLNLNFDRYAMPVGSGTLGQAGSAVVLTPAWGGAVPELSGLRIAGRRGVDLNPPDPQSEGERLLAYLWPDQPARLTRLAGALRIAAEHPVTVDRGDAAGWLEARLDSPWPGACHLVYHTIAHQYFPSETQARIRRAMEAAGARATAGAPLAWLGMEADSLPGGAGVTLRFWPGDLRLTLGRAGFHGQWVEWSGLGEALLPSEP